MEDNFSKLRCLVEGTLSETKLQCTYPAFVVSIMEGYGYEYDAESNGDDKFVWFKKEGSPKIEFMFDTWSGSSRGWVEGYG